MSHEIPQQPAREEVEHTPEVRLFNIDAMRDEQIIVLHRALVMAGEFAGGEDDIVDTSGVSDEMNNSFGRELRGLSRQSPDRIWNIVERCNLSKEKSDWLLAAVAAPGLATRNLPLVVETLFKYATFKDDSHDFVAQLAQEAAHTNLMIVMRDHLTPEQNEELTQRYAAADGIGHLYPARPETEHWYG